MKKNSKIIVCFDFGSIFVRVIAARISPVEKTEILFREQMQTPYIKNGIVTNVPKATEVVETLLNRVELEIEPSVDKIFINVSGSHVKRHSYSSSVKLKNRKILNYDLDYATYGWMVELDKPFWNVDTEQVFYIDIEDIVVDGVSHIDNPIKMIANEMTLKLNVYTGQHSFIQNIINIFSEIGVSLILNHCFPSCLAIGYGILEPEDKNSGILVLDIGGALSHILVYQGGKMKHNSTIDLGYDFVIGAISKELGISFEESRDLQAKWLSLDRSQIGVDENIFQESLSQLTFQRFSSKELNQIIEKKLILVFSKINAHLVKNKCKSFGSMIMIGGPSKIKGILSVARKVFQMPIRFANTKVFSCGTETNYDWFLALGLVEMAKKKEFFQLSHRPKLLEKMRHTAYAFCSELF